MKLLGSPAGRYVCEPQQRALTDFVAPLGAASPSLPVLGPLPRDTSPTYHSQDLDLGMPHHPELPIAVLELPPVAVTPLPRAHFNPGLHGLGLCLLLIFLVWGCGGRGGALPAMVPPVQVPLEQVLLE